MNQVILVGRLTRDPEISFTVNGKAITKMTLAVDRFRKDSEDAGADFIRVTVFGALAESCQRYLEKGRQAAVQGRIQTGSYEKDGKKIYTTDVIADRVEFVGGNNTRSSEKSDYVDNNYKGGNFEAPEAKFAPQTWDDLPDTFQSAEDDIPF